jgi:hypothetical protein
MPNEENSHTDTDGTNIGAKKKKHGIFKVSK